MWTNKKVVRICCQAIMLKWPNTLWNYQVGVDKTKTERVQSELGGTGKLRDNRISGDIKMTLLSWAGNYSLNDQQESQETRQVSLAGEGAGARGGGGEWNLITESGTKLPWSTEGTLCCCEYAVSCEAQEHLYLPLEVHSRNCPFQILSQIQFWRC